MKKNTRRVLALLLCIVLAMSSLTGCSSNKEAGLSATPVDFDSQGNYATTITIEGGKFAKNLSAGDVRVSYEVWDFAKLCSTVELTDTDIVQYVKNIEVKATEVSVKDAGTIEVKFSDSASSENLPYDYTVTIGDKDALTANVRVNYPTYRLTTDLNSVSVLENKVKLALSIDGTTFASGFSAADVILGGSFAGMSVEVLSVSDKNATIVISGTMKKQDISNAFVDGTVNVTKNGLKNGYDTVTAIVPVETLALGVLPESMKFSGNQVTVPVHVSGYTFAEGTGKSDIEVEGATVVDFAREDDQNAILKLNVSGCANVGEAAAALNGRKISVAGKALGSAENVTCVADFSTASFYPVFDYVESKGDTLNITLILYPVLGSFADGVGQNQVSFGDGFEDAKVQSFKKAEDGTCEMVISIPSGGMDENSLNVIGTVVLKNGALINRWGEKLNTEAAYTRVYSPETLSRAYTMDGFKAFCANFAISPVTNALAQGATIAGFGATAFSVVNGAITLLDSLGIVDSRETKLLKSINDSLDNIQDELAKQSEQLAELIDITNKKSISEFNVKVNSLLTYTELTQAYLTDAVNEVNKKHKMPAITSEQLCGTTLSDAEKKAGVQEWEEYLSLLLDELDVNNNISLNSKITELENKLIEVVDSLAENTSNPVDLFDAGCVKKYNFSANALYERQAYRDRIQYAVEQAVTVLLVLKNGVKNRESSVIGNYINLRNKAVKYLNDDSRKLTSNGTAYCYVTGCDVTKDALAYMSPAQLAAMSKPQIKSVMHARAKSTQAKLFIPSMTEDQWDEFVKRMGGRTIAEELTILSEYLDLGKNREAYLDSTIYVTDFKDDIGWNDYGDGTYSAELYYCSYVKLNTVGHEESTPNLEVVFNDRNMNLYFAVVRGAVH